MSLTTSKKSIFITVLFGTIFFFGVTGVASALNTNIYGPGSVSADTMIVVGTEVATDAGLPQVEMIPPPVTDPLDIENFSCGLSLTKFVELKGCLPIGVYYLLYKPASFVLMGGGLLFDKMLDLSIKKEFVDRPFINSSWEVVRDFSNMLFIFILLYTGISTMLGAKDWRAVVLKVIIIALLINFSLFFTKVVIDAGNILATGVYSSINTENLSLSESLVKNFEPQTFLKTAGKVDALDAIVIFLIAGAINAYAGYIFFKAALLFLGRLIAFWFLMIVSPFAFISIALPKGNVFGDWWNTLLNQSFVAPVYLFLLYLIMQVVNVKEGVLGDMPTLREGDSWLFSKLLTPIIVAALIMFAMQQALKIAAKMAGDFGKMGADATTKAMGLAAGAATGGVAMAGRTFIGGAAAGALRRGVKTEDELSTMTPEARASYDRSRARLQTLTKSSYDVRSLAGEKSILGKTAGGLISKGGGAFGVNVGKATLGGVEKTTKDAEKKAIDNVPKLSIFEEQEISRRAIKQAEVNKVEVAKAEAEVEAAEKAYEDSGAEALVVAAKANAESAKAMAEDAAKRTKDAQTAFDASKASGRRSINSPEWKALEDARNIENDAMKNLIEADEKFADAVNEDKKGKSKIADVIEETKKARGKETDSKKLATAEIAKENTRRRNAHADNVEGSKKDWGDTHTANKIRKGEESDHAKKLKELTAKKKKAEEEGKSTDYVNAIEDQIKETKGDVKKDEEIKK